MQEAYKLKYTDFGISRDYPSEILSARKSLWWLYKEKRRNRYSKCSIKYPAKLVVNGVVLHDCFPEWDAAMHVNRIEPRKPQISVHDEASSSRESPRTRRADPLRYRDAVTGSNDNNSASSSKWRLPTPQQSPRFTAPKRNAEQNCSTTKEADASTNGTVTAQSAPSTEQRTVMSPTNGTLSTRVHQTQESGGASASTPQLQLKLVKTAVVDAPNHDVHSLNVARSDAQKDRSNMQNALATNINHANRPAGHPC